MARQLPSTLGPAKAVQVVKTNLFFILQVYVLHTSLFLPHLCQIFRHLLLLLDCLLIQAILGRFLFLPCSLGLWILVLGLGVFPSFLPRPFPFPLPVPRPAPRAFFAGGSEASAPSRMDFRTSSQQVNLYLLYVSLPGLASMLKSQL